MATAVRGGLAVVQFCASHDVATNISTCKRLILDACQKGAQFVCLPEAFDFIGRPSSTDNFSLSTPLDGSVVTDFARFAADHNVWLSLGGFHESPTDDPTRTCNTHVIVNNNGKVVASYRKVHLFDVDYDGGFKESTTTKPGTHLTLVKDTPIGNVGVTTCYDLRFPEMYAALQHAGADVLLVPSAFMPTTGKAHWHTLLRARAIETQCYVAAAAQTGQHNASRSSFGHSLLIDPFGEVLADLGEDSEATAVCTVDVDHLQQIRTKMPIIQHRKAAEHLIRIVVPDANWSVCD